MTAEKKCSKCGDIKPATTDFFHAHASCLYGVSSICRTCYKAGSKDRYRRNRAAVIARSAQYGRDNPEVRRAAVARYRARHPDRAKEQDRRSRSKAKAKLANRRARLKSEPPSDESLTRICPKCGDTKLATVANFPIDPAMRDGLASWCRECRNSREKSWRKTPEAKARARNTALLTRISETPEQRAERLRRHRRCPSQQPEARRARGAAYAARKKADPVWLLRCRFSCLFHNTLRRKIRNGEARAGQSWTRVLGYSLDELMRHLERQFTRKMTWQNMGKNGWHIDHIIPISSFSYADADDPEFSRAWALSNLRPLWWDENLKKSARRLHLL